MRRTDRGMLVLMLSLSVVAAEGNGQDDPPPPAEQYKALRKEYDRASGSGVPLTDAERLKFVGQVYKRRNALALKFLDLPLQARQTVTRETAAGIARQE